ncbi:acyltransferase family protein [Gemella cuniculi]|uniref:acyltransferase family protein n=1 Tax=Gemella cuniculi TaxID=150240 RepID=UPI00054D5CCB|nr:acyltransferase [Gemella cuniculi]
MNKRIVEYDILKIIAIILVVLSHSTYYQIVSSYGGVDYQTYIASDSAEKTYKIFDKVREILYYFHMPMFMAISGTFFYIQVKNKRWCNFNQFLSNKFKRLLIPYIAFTLFYTIPLKYISDYFNNISIARGIVGQLFLLGNSHLWYLYTLFVIFLISFYILKLEMKVYIFVILYIVHLLGYYIKITIVGAPLQFLFWFSLGFLFESKREYYNKFIKNNRLYDLIIVMLFLVLILINFYIKNNSYFVSRIVVDVLAVLGSLICYNFSYNISILHKKILNNVLFKNILINGLGIYIFSDTLNYLILKLAYLLDNNFMFTSTGIIIIVISRFFMTFLMSLLITKLFKKLFKKYNWMVN